MPWYLPNLHPNQLLQPSPTPLPIQRPIPPLPLHLIRPSSLNQRPKRTNGRPIPHPLLQTRRRIHRRPANPSLLVLGTVIARRTPGPSLLISLLVLGKERELPLRRLSEVEALPLRREGDFGEGWLRGFGVGWVGVASCDVGCCGVQGGIVDISGTPYSGHGASIASPSFEAEDEDEGRDGQEG